MNYSAKKNINLYRLRLMKFVKISKRKYLSRNQKLRELDGYESLGRPASNGSLPSDQLEPKYFSLQK